MGEVRWRFGLTAEEWLQLAARGEDSEVGPCCGAVGTLREYLNALATDQEPGVSAFEDPVLLTWRKIVASDDPHNLHDRDRFPLLHRVLDGIKWNQTNIEVPPDV